MILDELKKYDPITIQCHDNPDADAIGSGYGLYCYFKKLGKNIKLIYSGRNQIQKANLVMMVEQLHIPIEYRDPSKEENKYVAGLLITTDCQYGAGNVTKLDADEIAIIDHHQVEIENVEKSLIRSDLGSCSTLVWKLIKDSKIDLDFEEGLGTALYYGLYTDTNSLSEISNPLDRDAADQLPHDNSMITLLRNSNLTLHELEIAGIAMLRYSYNEDYGFAVVRSQPCDPNILGLISDFLLQVDKVKTCVVFNETDGGIKLSVRSCVKEVNASELASFLTEGIGSGGGHYEKAGGFINQKKYREKYQNLHADGYINSRMAEYFDTYEIIYAKDYDIDTSEMQLYQKKKLPLGFVMAKDVLPIGTPITVRSLEGDIDLVVEDDLYIMIGIKGEVYPNREAKFKKSNEVLDKKYVYEECVIDNSYVPTIKSRVDGRNLLITDYAHVCVPTGSVKIYVRQLTKGVKVFTAWDKEKYMLGKPGDYLASRCDDPHDIYVIERKIFGITYESAE